jgi:hypothetical protein
MSRPPPRWAFACVGVAILAGGAFVAALKLLGVPPFGPVPWWMLAGIVAIPLARECVIPLARSISSGQPSPGS